MHSLITCGQSASPSQPWNLLISNPSFVLNVRSPQFSSTSPAFNLFTLFFYSSLFFPPLASAFSLFRPLSAPSLNPILSRSSCHPSVLMTRLLGHRINTGNPVMSSPFQNPLSSFYPSKGSRHESVHRYGRTNFLETEFHSVHQF